ncbi:MAG: hypothetical protein AB1705_18220 [Verrucomicrobiota bacterium]
MKSDSASIALILLVVFFCVVWTGWMASVAWRWVKRRRRGPHFPAIDRSQILHSEKFGSGLSHRSRWFRPRANNCLLFTVTRDELWVSPWAPLTTLLGNFDLEHRIRKADIERLAVKSVFWVKRFEITFRLPDGQSRRIDLYSHKPDEFLAALRANGTFPVEEY